MSIRALSLAFSLAVSGLAATPGFSISLTKETLLEGCPIPARREFPVSEAHPACQDFYAYACTAVNASFHLPEDRSAHTFSFSDSSERLLYAKKKYMAMLPELKELSPRAERLKTYYTACMDSAASAAEEKEIVQAEIKAVKQLKDREGFAAFLASRMDQPELSFAGVDDIPNQDDPDWNDALFTGRIMSLPERSYYANAEVVADLQALAAKLFKAAGVDKPQARAKQVVAFEKEFAKIYPLPAEIRQRFSARDQITREKLLSDYPALKFDRILQRLPARTKLRNLIPESLAFINMALQKRSLEELKSVYLFHDLQRYMDDAYPEFYDQYFAFKRKHLGGPDKRPIRQERCTRRIMADFTKEIDAELLPVLFPGFPDAKVKSMAEEIRSSIIDGLKANTWLTPGAKDAAIKKMQTARLMAVRPLSDNEWDFTPPAAYSPKTPYKNAKLLNKNLIEKSLKEFGEARDRSRWHMGPLTVNAYYTAMDNVFVLPIGILQYPFFDPDQPEHLNIGAIGAVIGHELGHGIDDQGAKYDEKGRLVDWMTPADHKEFMARGAKFVDRFNKIGHDGSLTLGENIGDHVGLTFAYQAAFKGKTPSAEETKAFFLSYARAWCQVMRPKYRAMLLKTDPHASGEARVNEQVRHQNAFQEAYGCKAGDPMFLEAKDRIRVW